MKYYSFFIVVAIQLIACKNSTEYVRTMHDPLLFSKTVHELNNVVMGNNFTPVVASRNYTYAAIAAHEVITAENKNKIYRSLAGQLKGLKESPRPEAADKIDYPYAALIAYCRVGNAVTFPEGSMDEYLALLQKKAEDSGMPSSMLESSTKYGNKVADHIIEWAKMDNYAETRSASKYSVTDEEGRWVPTPPMYAQAVEPHWMEIRPMIMEDVSLYRAPAPLKFNIKDKASPYYKELMAIKNAGDSLTPEQKHIAEFWDDNPFKLNVSGHVMFGTKKFSPTGHWMSIVGIAAEKAHADFEETVYAYALTGVAMFDAFIECWDTKYAYNTVRPETVINKYVDAEWRPFLQTPAFPEYTCGHSTVSAAAEALTKVFGDNFAYTDSTELEFSIKSRSFTSFRQAAIENNWARFYGAFTFIIPAYFPPNMARRWAIL